MRPEAAYRDNAAALVRMVDGLRRPVGDQRRRDAIRGIMLHWLDAADGPSIVAATLLRFGVCLEEEPLLEAWTQRFAASDQFGFVSFLRVVAGQARSVVDIYNNHGRAKSPRLAILAVTERLLGSKDLAAAGRWPADGVAPARVVIDRLAKFTHVLGRLDVTDRLRQITAELDRPTLASASAVLFSPNFFHAIGHIVVGRALADLIRVLRGAAVSFTTIRTDAANPALARAATRDFAAGPPPDGAKVLNAMSDSLVPIADRRGLAASSGAAWSMTKVTSWAATRWIDACPLDRAEVEALGEEARAFLAANGVSPERFLVTLHVRDSGYRGPSYADGQRDGDIERYGPAIDRIVAAGGVVVRLGDPSMVAMRARAHVIDYAHGDDRSDRMDIALASLARFHIGSASGMSFVPLLFAKPVLFTNWITLAHVVVTPNTLHLPKHLMHVDGRRVGLETQCQRYAWAIQTEHIETDGLYFQENSAAEIDDAVAYMMEHLDEGGRLRLPEDVVAGQRACFAAHGLDPAPVLPPNAMAAWTTNGSAL